jgi:hypothetical protein
VNKRLNTFRIDNTIANSGTDTAIESVSQVRGGTSRAFGNAPEYFVEPQSSAKATMSRDRSFIA